MAITIESQPGSEVTGDRVIFEVSQSAPAAGIIRQGRVQLRDHLGNPVTPWEPWTNLTGITLRFDFSDICRTQLDAYTPNLNNVIKFNMADLATFRCKLAYQEIDFDTSDCSSTEGSVNETSEIEVYNAFFMPWQAEQELTDDEFVFSEKPLKIEMVRGQNDYLFFFTGPTSSLNFVVVELRKTPPDVSVHSETLSTNKYYAIGISGNNTEGVTTDLDDLIGVRIRLGAKIYDIIFTDENVDECEPLEFRECLFFEPMGTWSSIVFDKVSVSGSRSFTTATPLDIVEQDLSSYRRIESFGERILTNRSGPRFILEKNITDQIDMTRFYNGFASANMHFLKMKGLDGDYYPARVILETCGTYRAEDDSAVLSATFRLHKIMTSPTRTNFD